MRAAFVSGSQPMLRRMLTDNTCSRRLPLSSLSMSGKKGKKPAKKVTPPGNDSSPAPVETAVSTPASTPSPAAAKQVATKSALVIDDGPENAEIMAKATALLDAGRNQIGDGVGIGPGPMVTFTGQDGLDRTMGENERKGVSGNAFVVKATSKTVTIRLEGKFWGSRQWAFDAVSAYLQESMPGIQVAIEDEWQLKDLYLMDAFYGEKAWALRKVGPQYVNERGVQVGQPYYPDGKFEELLAEDGLNVNALQLGIEEMMKDALKQSKGSTFTDEMPLGKLDKELAGSQTAYFSEGSESEDIASMVEADNNIERVTKVPMSSLQGGMRSEVDQALQSNPMFTMMADMLENEPGAMQDIQELLESSKGNMFAVMSNPKFQKLAQKMMQNPELMQMMSDPNAVKSAMQSAQSFGITDAMGIKAPQGMSLDQAAKDLTDKTMGAMKTGMDKEDWTGDFGSEKPAWLADVENDVKQRNDRALADQTIEKQIAEARREMEASRMQVKKEEDDTFFSAGDDSFDLKAILEKSEEEKALESGASKLYEPSLLNDSQKEDLAYLAAGLGAIGAIIFFLGTQLGVWDVPFMQDLGVVSTPAARRGQSDATDKAPKKDTKEEASKKAPAAVDLKEDDTPF